MWVRDENGHKEEFTINPMNDGQLPLCVSLGSPEVIATKRTFLDIRGHARQVGIYNLICDADHDMVPEMLRVKPPKHSCDLDRGKAIRNVSE